MTPNQASPVVLTVQGTFAPASADAMRTLHDQTAGSPDGIAAARSFGDLSHRCFLPLGASKPTECLFVDVWTAAEGIQTFFSNEQTLQAGKKLFTSRDAVVWMPATGAFSFHLPAPASRRSRSLGMLRAAVPSVERAIEVFAGTLSAALPDARRRGQMSHQLFVRLGPPGTPPEILGLDEWFDPQGMGEHYQDQTHMAPLARAFSGAPRTSAWIQADPPWSEW